MSGVRAPRFAGVTSGVGTTTLAAALHGVDTGRYPGGPVDVLVCGTGSLAAAARLGGPVLAVVAGCPPRLDRLTAGFGAVVIVPEIAAWRALEAPDVAGLLGVAPQRRPARMRPYVDALLEITAALLRSGVLEGPAPAGERHRPAAVARTAVERIAAATSSRVARPAGVVAPASPSAVVAPDPAAGAATVARPLWRGLQAVERAPVLLSAAAPAPVPVSRAAPSAPEPVGGRALRLRAELDDDAVESLRTG